VTAAERLRFVFQGIAEGLIFSLLVCVLGTLTLKLSGGLETVKDPQAVVPRTFAGSAP
jgi:hypothetical protein